MEPIGQSITLTDHDWHIRERIGEGASGKVYSASTPNFPNGAVKLIVKDPGAQREVTFKDLSGVPNVVPVLDYGEWNDHWVIAMPRAEKSLRRLLEERSRLPEHEAVAILRDMSEALVGLEEGVVHRDIKPENVLLLGGRWCLADFGIARYAEATTAPDTRKSWMTPEYAAPEQWERRRATTATDVYATGVVAYEMLAGSLPFSGPDFRIQHLQENPKPVAGVSPVLSGLIEACLFKHPGTRPTPQVLLDRLGTSSEPASSGAHKLQEASAQSARREAEDQGLDAIRQSTREEWKQLCGVAEQSLANVVEELCEEIRKHAPECELLPYSKGGMVAALEGARLEVRIPETKEPEAMEGAAPFTVAAFTSIAVTLPEERNSYLGREHSLWFCDAAREGEFLWYETAFIFHALAARTSSIVPFAQDPGNDTRLALCPGMHTVDVARPFVPIAHGEAGEFVSRWTGWFAEAALGQLYHPSHLPEGTPRGSWRVDGC